MDEANEINPRAQVSTWVPELCRLLEQQITCVREGHLARIEPLQERSDALVAQIALATGADPQGMGAGRGQVQELYAELRLALMAQREETRAALHAVRRGKRMVRTYGNHISSL